MAIYDLNEELARRRSEAEYRAQRNAKREKLLIALEAQCRADGLSEAATRDCISSTRSAFAMNDAWNAIIGQGGFK